MKTPELIAEEVTDYYDGLFEGLEGARYNAAVMAVELLEESYELADYMEGIKKYLAENELPDITKVAFAADIRDILESLGVKP